MVYADIGVNKQCRAKLQNRGQESIDPDRTAVPMGWSLQTPKEKKYGLDDITEKRGPHEPLISLTEEISRLHPRDGGSV